RAPLPKGSRVRARLPPPADGDLRLQRACAPPRRARRLDPRGSEAKGVLAARRVDGRNHVRTDPRRSGGLMELIHTCYRIGDIDRSVAFYTALGFEERRRLPIRDEAINVFMGLPGDDDRLELTYNFGVDSYEIGTGYGHIAVP